MYKYAIPKKVIIIYILRNITVAPAPMLRPYNTNAISPSHFLSNKINIFLITKNVSMKNIRFIAKIIYI